MFASIAAISVLTFNIRYGTANDGENSWQFRKNAVFEVLARGYDIIGMQEVLKEQLAEIQATLPNYRAVSRSRESDPSVGEATSVLYDAQKWKLVKNSFFWLSKTPDVPGSRDWGMRMPRMVTRVILQSISTGQKLCVYNTHYDYEIPAAQLEGSKVIFSRLGECAELPTIIMGDFNNVETNPAISYFTENTRPIALEDSWRKLHPNEHLGTWHDWKGNLDGDRIDFIFTSKRDLVPKSSKILSDRVQGRHASDHFPVETVLEFRE